VFELLELKVLPRVSEKDPFEKPAPKLPPT
jgi:hypothetical protein